MVKAHTAKVTAAPALPWYLSALLLVQPLRFGDFGGLAVKILRALLYIVTIIVLGGAAFIYGCAS